jgi:hypothetical protein
MQDCKLPIVHVGCLGELRDGRDWQFLDGHRERSCRAVCSLKKGQNFWTGLLSGTPGSGGN